ncbi:MAG: single-stranded-DNA-specific exonuclease RecJ [Anaerolineaceae bacterium]|nr:single-stranded-DNA-specific exonuclease RecJ [Anaerolineaceae bacterium]
MKHWLDPVSVSIPADLQQAVGGHAVVAQRLVRQGITTPQAANQFLSPLNYAPASPYDLPDMDLAVRRVQQSIKEGQTILVWGDFDVDGQTSTALLVSALRELGAKVTYHIPNRFTEGHGIHLPTLTTLLDGSIDLLLTCDTGISANPAVHLAHMNHVDVVITDHHALPFLLPEAEAVVNPMRLPEGHPMRELPGVGTAYQLVRALYGDKSTDHLLDLVALGIVADVMVQVDDTRYWLKRGLEILRSSPRPGIQAILERAEINPPDLTESDIGFSIGPRLNALGRLADANPAVELLTTSDKTIITERVNELEGLNQKRRFLTRQVYEGAQQKIQDDDSLLKYAALVLSGEGWHSGVVGIVASRLAEDYACPVILLSENDGLLSGSARSVAGCNIIEAITSQSALLKSYGGHSMAAGLSLPAENLFEFRRGLSGVVREALGTNAVEPQIVIDAFVGLPEINLPFAEDIGRLAPFGNGNPPLTLATRNLHVKSRRTLGSRGDHIELRLADDNGSEQRVIWWFGDVNAVPQTKFDLAYTVRPNVFNGKRESLIEWLDARVSQVDLASAAEDTFTVVDYRRETDPLTLLAQVQTDYPEALIWREGTTDIAGVDRYHLHEAQTLVVWTAPPDSVVWSAVQAEVQPQTLILFGQHTPFEAPKALLTQLAGLLKYAINHKQGMVTASELAALTGQTDLMIRTALKWFNLHSELVVTAFSEDMYQITNRSTAPSTTDSAYAERLKILATETAAYHRYWRSLEFD